MRVAIITESFAPDVNGVANSVLRVGEHLLATGHHPMVIAPRPRRSVRTAIQDHGYPVVRLASLPFPGYRNVRLALPTRLINQHLEEFKPDVVHLASPFVLGAWGSKAAAELGIPMVAVYQTDVPGYAEAYGLRAARDLSWRWISGIHGRATVTLAPSSATAAQLTEHGIPRVERWGRGVDTELFRPQRRSTELRRALAPNGEVIVGYVGRLANEKRVDLLSEVAKLPGVRVVVVGDGPTRRPVERAVPGAVFLGGRSGIALAEAYASLDVFVHTGPHETFCQTIQEAHASGVPVIAPAWGGPIDLVESGVTGYLVPPNDAVAIAAAAAPLVADAELRAQMGLTARVAVANRTWSALGDQLIGHYRTALGLPASAAEPTLEPVP